MQPAEQRSGATGVNARGEKSGGAARQEVARTFFVVGAAKAGTTSVYHYLKQHPQVFLHEYKDVACYFCENYGMAITLDQFKSMLRPTSGKYRIAGDVCSDYLTDPRAAADIAGAFPDAKIIIILRDPVERALSLYQWMIREGYEYLPTFEAALAAEQERLSRKMKGADLVSPCKQAYLYFHSGLYSHQVKRFLDHFPRRQVLFLKYENLRSDGPAFMRKIYAFLGVDASFAPEIRIYNRAAGPISVAFQYFCRRRLSRFVPHAVVPYIMRFNTRGQCMARLDDGLRMELRARYAQDIKSTEEITGLELESWLVR